MKACLSGLLTRDVGQAAVFLIPMGLATGAVARQAALRSGVGAPWGNAAWIVVATSLVVYSAARACRYSPAQSLKLSAVFGGLEFAMEAATIALPNSI